MSNTLSSSPFVVIVCKREAIPIRAIPFITDWIPELNPLRIAEHLRDNGRGSFFSSLFAYELEKGIPKKFLPKKWQHVIDSLRGLSSELLIKYPDGTDSYNFGYSEWKRKSPELLPPGVFMWRDEFESRYAKNITNAYRFPDLDDLAPKEGDLDLDYDAEIPKDVLASVMDGFLHSNLDALDTLSKGSVNDAEAYPAQDVSMKEGLDASIGTSGCKVFRGMKNLMGDQLTIAFVGDKPESNTSIGANNMLEISACNETRLVPLAALNLVNRQNGGLNGEGMILLGFTKYKHLPRSNAKATKMTRLRNIFKEHLGIKSDPFFPCREGVGWEPRFKIEDRRGAAEKRAKREAEHKTMSLDEMNERGEMIGDDDYPYEDEDDETGRLLRGIQT